MRVSIALVFLTFLFGAQITFGQVVNDITIQPSNPTTNDTIFVISDFSYYGNCAVGIVNSQINQSGSVINIYPEYCGFGATTLCNAVDTFSLGILPTGNYTVNIEYHQGTVCAGSFDTIIANFDTTFQIGPLSIGTIVSKNMEVSVFPNPFIDNIIINGVYSDFNYEITNVSGQKIKAGSLDKSTINNLGSLPSGVYFLKLNEKEKIYKIIKK